MTHSLWPLGPLLMPAYPLYKTKAFPGCQWFSNSSYTPLSKAIQTFLCVHSQKLTLPVSGTLGQHQEKRWDSASGQGIDAIHITIMIIMADTSKEPITCWALRQAYHREP